MLSVILKVVLFYLLSTASLRTSARSSDNNVLNPDFETFVNQLLAEWNSPGGVAIAVIRKTEQGGWNVETRGYGIAKGDGSRVNENTLFAIGSNSKLFTAIATGLSISNETLTPPLSWSSKIASIMPRWGLQDPIAATESTIIDLMSHRTGLPRHELSYRWSDDIPSLIEKVKAQRSSAEFRDVWQYNNNMYTLLSYLPPLLLPSKIPFARYVKEHIFDPFGMNSTTYSFEQANGTGNLADGLAMQMENGNSTMRVLPYWAQDGGDDGNLLSGAGGVISNVVDLATWLRALLLGGVHPSTNQSVIPGDILQKVTTGFSVQSGGAPPFPELSPIVYGGGQTRSTYRGHERIEHGGDVTGFHSQISRLPFDNIGVVVLTNDDRSGNPISEIIKFYLLDSALGLELIDWNSRYKSFTGGFPSTPATPRPGNATLPVRDFAALAGRYINTGYGPLELCLVSESNSSATSSECQALVADAPKVLPGALNPDIPTFLAGWDSIWSSHIRLTHFDGNVFNMSALTSFPTGDASSPCWTYPFASADNDTGTVVEFAVLDGNDNQQTLGFSLRGVWGAGNGISSPLGNDVRERAEVWFDRV